jgi:DNA polymerase-1
LMTERGLNVLCPVHDAFLLQAPVVELESTVAAAQAAMAEASRVVLKGHEIKTDVEPTVWPDRCTDARGAALWQKVCTQLEKRGALGDL